MESPVPRTYRYQEKIIRTIAKNVKKWRLERGLSQAALAARAKVPRTYISMIERCERNLSILSIEGVAKALKVKVSELTHPH